MNFVVISKYVQTENKKDIMSVSTDLWKMWVFILFVCDLAALPRKCVLYMWINHDASTVQMDDLFSFIHSNCSIPLQLPEKKGVECSNQMQAIPDSLRP